MNHLHRFLIFSLLVMPVVSLAADPAVTGIVGGLVSDLAKDAKAAFKDLMFGFGILLGGFLSLGLLLLGIRYIYNFIVGKVSSYFNSNQIGEYVRLPDGSFIPLNEYYLGYSEKDYNFVNSWLDSEVAGSTVHFSNAQFDWDQRDLLNDPALDLLGNHNMVIVGFNDTHIDDPWSNDPTPRPDFFDPFAESLPDDRLPDDREYPLREVLDVETGEFSIEEFINDESDFVDYPWR